MRNCHPAPRFTRFAHVNPEIFSATVPPRRAQACDGARSDYDGPMFDVAQNVLPVFLMIFIGWLIVATKYLKPEAGIALSEFASAFSGALNDAKSFCFDIIQ